MPYQPMTLADSCTESCSNLMSSGNLTDAPSSKPSCHQGLSLLSQLSRNIVCAQATAMLFQREVSMSIQLPKAVCLISSPIRHCQHGIPKSHIESALPDWLRPFVNTAVNIAQSLKDFVTPTQLHFRAYGLSLLCPK